MNLLNSQARMAEFMHESSQETSPIPIVPDFQDAAAGISLITFGLNQVKEACYIHRDEVFYADAITRLLFSVLMLATRTGIPLEACYDEYLEASMSQFDGGYTDLIKQEWVPGPNTHQPDLRSIIEKAIAERGE